MGTLDEPVADPDGGGRDKLASALDDVDLAAGDQAGQALPEPGDDFVLVGVHAIHVDAVKAAAHAQSRAVVGEVSDLGGVQQRLGRYAAPVQAGAADLVLLYERDPLAQLCRAQSAGIAAAAAAKNDDVVGRLAGATVAHVCAP